MKKEVQQMKDQSVFTAIDGNTLTQEQQANIIESRWVLKQKHNEVRARIVAKGYTVSATDHDLLFASAPPFLHAAAIMPYNLVMRPPHEFYNEGNRHIMWRLNKAMYGLRSSRKQWQDHIAHILAVALELVRCTTESNVYTSKDCQV